MAKIVPAPLTRTVAEIAFEIRNDYAAKGKPVYYAAKPYVDAMREIHTSDLSRPYFNDPCDSVIRYALSNLSTWRGETATRVKAELRAALADYDSRR